MRRRTRWAALGALVPLSLAACASLAASGPAHQTYAGAELPVTQVAFITLQDDGGWATTFRTIDGKRPPAGTRRIAVLAGKHSIVIDVVITQTGGGITSSVTANKTLDVEAVAGRSYVLNQGNIR